MGHKQPLSVDNILENRLRMAVLNVVVFALMYLTIKATTIFMNMLCNKVLLDVFILETAKTKIVSFNRY